MQNNNIVDCHSHIGNDWVWGKSTFDGYIKLIDRIGVNVSLLMPVPGQLDFETGSKRLLRWKYENNKFNYWSEKENTVPSSKLFNEPVYDIISKYQGDKRLFFVPFIHPVLDTVDYLYEIVKKYKPVAFKIHGVACGVIPSLFGKKFIEALKDIDIPVIVHTDYSEDVDSIQYKNNSLSWAKFFVKNKIKGYLTHAARVDMETWNLVNDNDNIVVGVGPDLLISSRKHTLKDSDKFSLDNVLEMLNEKVDVNKMMFDIDYSWNVKNENKELDYEMIDRIKKIFGEERAAKILSSNPIKFFGLDV